MNTDNTFVRAVHDVTQAAWFGGSLMGAVAIDSATRAVPDPTVRLEVADNAWKAWHRVRTPMLLAHLAAGAGMIYANKGRLTAQRGATTTTVMRTVVTGAAICSESCAQSLGRRLAQSPSETVEGSTTPMEGTDDRIAATQRRLRMAQWTTVALTGAIVVLGAKMGEQQRPTNVLRGAMDRLGLAA